MRQAPVAVLIAPVDIDLHPGLLVAHADARLRAIAVLSTGTGTDCAPDVAFGLGEESNLALGRHGKNGDQDIRCLAAVAALGRRDPLHTVGPGLVLEGLTCAVPDDARGDLAVNRIDKLDLEPFGLGPFRIGGKQIVNEELGVFTTGAGMNFEEHFSGAKDRRTASTAVTSGPEACG